MLFPTFTFAAFFAVVLPVSWVLRRHATVWKLFVLAASGLFYGYWDPRFLLLLGAMTVVNELAAMAIHRSVNERARKAALVTAVLFDLVVLGFFKYYGFFLNSLDSAFSLSSPALNVILPVGISFFTFQAISYVVDVHRRDCLPAPLLDFAVYLSFFPQLVAGPIVRATEFLPELRATRVPDSLETGRAVILIGRGLFKKVVIADFLGRAVVDDAFGTPGEYGALDILTGIYGYAIQIYADFSGYTDMAIGIALLLGFRFPQNFDRPYAAVSVQDFWRRWHITLSRWLRDYVYVPLGGNRGGRGKTYRNLMITMGLGGLWHGAAWTFIVWGLLHGGALAVERLISEFRGDSEIEFDAADVRIRELARLHSGVEVDAWREDPTSPVPFGPVETRRLWVGRLITFHFVCAGWVIFYAGTTEGGGLSGAGDTFTGLLTGWTVMPELLNPLVALVLIGAITAQYLPPMLGRQLSAMFSTLPPVAVSIGFAVWIMLVVALGPEGISEFIYFQF
ncbi:MAG: MBOAT family protein [Acidimicrobiaceae bacterium]|jgi:alginate O-acetyltransferase complex protein AlgI|nr:MBOAT family protein [Acidimicrobiaceae bacterium]MBT5580864.1 MBOAT family protein [Acidimicrobiaceae bacterium]MBT5848846.1 MBOAT family protein [Acidimicrobiaceae bacterium]